MKNKKITRKITQGVYVLTTQNGGCIVDAVSQISSDDNPLISVAVMKSNNTNKLLHENKYFALSVVGLKTNPKIIETFGLNSMRDIDKFKDLPSTKVNDINIMDGTLGYMICEIVDRIDASTHTLFIGKLIDADVTLDEEAMSYQYYQEHKDELLKVTTEKGKTAWVCTLCGYVYYGETLPDNFICPRCGIDRSAFVRKNDCEN